jgi:hypothetical protein
MEENKSSLEKEIEKTILNILENQKTNLGKEDIKEIMKEIIPTLDNLISKQIKNHLVFISKIILEKFEEKENK